MLLRPGAGAPWVPLLAAGGVFLILGTLAHYNFIGGGDVKLIAAVCLLVPPDGIPLLLIEIALAGGVLSCIYLAGGFLLRLTPSLYRVSPDFVHRSAFRKWLRREEVRMARGYPMPYAVAILGGVTVHLMRELAPCFSATSCSL